MMEKLYRREGEYRYRLPTETEWEYAGRAGNSTAFANGGISETGCGYDASLNAMGWYCGNSNKKTHPVARKQANACGLYDMQGNVWEWCQDGGLSFRIYHRSSKLFYFYLAAPGEPWRQLERRSQGLSFDESQQGDQRR